MRSLAVLSVSLILHTAFAQHRLADGGPYEPSVPLPEKFLGYEIGKRFTDSPSITRYCLLLAEASDRVAVQEYGRSVEGHPLIVLFISDPRNLRRLNEINAANRSLTDPRITPREKVLPILDTLPAVLWLSFGVHGNESSSSECAMAVAYELAASRDPSVAAVLDSAVIILDPLVNPDGRQRYVLWYRSVTGKAPRTDPDAAEHHEPWPGSRTNHYFFDLNRDWSWSTQQETRARVALYLRWMPHVHVDYHEMDYTSTYFFFPSALPMHSQLPEQVRKWGTIFGRANAEVFDRIGIRYFTGESFDLFYPGYGDSWPTFSGAIGMTYEQAGHARAGLAVRRPDGSLLTLRERVRNHYLTAITTLRTAVAHRRERLVDFHEFWKTGLTAAGPLRAFLIPPGRDPGTAAELAQTLFRQGIEIGQTTSPMVIRAAPLLEARAREMSFPAGTYVINLRQPQSRLARALLEARAAVRDTAFYDVSAWSLPLAFGVETAWTEQEVPALPPLTSSPCAPPGTIVGGRAAYAYLIPWDRAASYAVVWDLLKRGFRVHVAERTFRLQGQEFRRGTCIAFVTDQPDSLHQVLERSARSHGVDILSTSTGWTEAGINLGSNHIRPLRRPEIGILTEEPVSPGDYGELWHLLDERLDIPFTPIAGRTLPRADLARFNVLVIPDGSDFTRVLDSVQADRVKRWVREGGVLIAIEGAARHFLRENSGFPELGRKTRAPKESRGQDSIATADPGRKSFQDREDLRRRNRVPGTILKVDVDTTHPSGYALSPELCVFKGDGAAMGVSEEAHVIAAYSRDTIAVSGYLPPGRGTQTARSPYLAERELGKGRVVLFAENPTFRGFWRGTERLLLNTLFFGIRGDL